jgi:hypothetical protein
MTDVWNSMELSCQTLLMLQSYMVFLFPCGGGGTFKTVSEVRSGVMPRLNK